jgi:hypothetical protein
MCLKIKALSILQAEHSEGKVEGVRQTGGARHANRAARQTIKRTSRQRELK